MGFKGYLGFAIVNTIIAFLFLLIGSFGMLNGIVALFCYYKSFIKYDQNNK